MNGVLRYALFTWMLIGGGCVSLQGQNPEQPAGIVYDIIIRGGMVYDGSGASPYVADIAVNADTIARIGVLDEARGYEEIDARGLAVAPGFINMLSWAAESLRRDGRSQSDIRQGVTLEVFGEGWSLGPLSEAMRADRYGAARATLGEALEDLAARGISTNIASFVGATTIRIHELGHENRAPTPGELERMKDLVRRAMEEGAVGLGSALLYAPAAFARTEELIALAQVVAGYDGLYISHIRSEAEDMLESVDELITIAREAGVRAEIYHLKVCGEANWPIMEQVIEKIESARSQGLAITADMYNYNASATGLDFNLPAWAHDGGHPALVQRLSDPVLRERIRKEMILPDPEKVRLVGFRNPSLRSLTGKTLAEAAALRDASPEEVVMDLILLDDSRVEAAYFTTSEENIRRQITLPWVSFGSDGESTAAEGMSGGYGVHPRSYGNFARLLGRYVREERLIPLEEAIRRLTTLPAENLRLRKRGALQVGYFADVVVFDPARIQDHATYEDPHRYATGVLHVLVNGIPVLKSGEHTGAKPGRVVRGQGWKGWKN